MTDAPLLNRRNFLRAAGALTAVGGAAGIVDLGRAATADPADAGSGLKIGYLPITDAAPLLIAHGAGLYDRQTISSGHPVMFRSWSSLAEAFLNRRVDVVHLLMPMAVQLRYSLGGAARILGWNHTNGSALTVAPDVRELGQLAGRQIAIPFWWSIHNIVVQKMLRANGLRPVVREAPSRSKKTVGLVVMSPSDMLPALANGSIGAYTVADPFNAAAEIKKVGRIHTFLGDVWRDHACCALLVHEDVIDRAPDSVQLLTDAVASAQLRIDGDRKAAAAQLKAGYLPQALPAITKALTYSPEQYRIGHADWSPQRIGYRPFPFPSFTQELVESMHDTVVDGDRRFLSTLDPATVHADLVDDRFVRRSIDSLGGPGAFSLPPSLTRTEEVDLT